tara:strand:- start:425 stop:727 length:303 start_codon:yes stop_codon:yes gene_type:complete
MITKRVIVIIKNVITLIHYGLKYLAMRALEVLREFRSISKEYHKSLKHSLDYIDNSRYISADYDEQDITEYSSTSKVELPVKKVTNSKWDKKSAPYCETP